MLITKCVFKGTLFTKSMLITICVILVCTKECPKVRDYPIIVYPIDFTQFAQLPKYISTKICNNAKPCFTNLKDHFCTRAEVLGQRYNRLFISFQLSL